MGDVVLSIASLGIWHANNLNKKESNKIQAFLTKKTKFVSTWVDVCQPSSFFFPFLLRVP